MGRMSRGVCRLCGRTSLLVGRSHIIPDFMYYDIMMPGRGSRLVAVADGRLSRTAHRQSGEYESGILCRECESDFSGHEEYVSRLLRGEVGRVGFQRSSDNKFDVACFSGLDYAQVKLCYLSILWRMHISTNPMFDQVNLGKTKAEYVRRMLLARDPGPSSLFPVQQMFYGHLQGPIGKNSVSGPYRGRMYSSTVYINAMAQSLYVFHVSKHGIPDWVRATSISESGEMQVAMIPRRVTRLFLNELMGLEVF